jgi:hypothetical protein
MERKSEERTTSGLDFARNLIQVDSLSQKFTAVMLEESTSVYGVGYVNQSTLLDINLIAIVPHVGFFSGPSPVIVLDSQPWSVSPRLWVSSPPYLYAAANYRRAAYLLDGARTNLLNAGLGD